jgi:hypothetical protein
MRHRRNAPEQKTLNAKGRDPMFSALRRAAVRMRMRTRACAECFSRMRTKGSDRVGTALQGTEYEEQRTVL